MSKVLYPYLITAEMGPKVVEFVQFHPNRLSAFGSADQLIVTDAQKLTMAEAKKRNVPYEIKEEDIKEVRWEK